MARELGATDFILPTGDTVVAQVQALVGAGVDFAFECVGVPALARQALEAAHPAWGLAVFVGLMPTGAELTAQPMTLLTGRRWTG